MELDLRDVTKWTFSNAMHFLVMTGYLCYAKSNDQFGAGSLPNYELMQTWKKVFVKFSVSENENDSQVSQVLSFSDEDLAKFMRDIPLRLECKNFMLSKEKRNYVYLT